MEILAWATVATWLLWGTLFAQIVGHEARGETASIASRRNCFLIMITYMALSLIMSLGVIVSGTN